VCEVPGLLQKLLPASSACITLTAFTCFASLAEKESSIGFMERYISLLFGKMKMEITFLKFDNKAKMCFPSSI
jgi:hypothetical protein